MLKAHVPVCCTEHVGMPIDVVGTFVTSMGIHSSQLVHGFMQTLMWKCRYAVKIMQCLLRLACHPF
jgi:hypothetical protein